MRSVSEYLDLANEYSSGVLSGQIPAGELTRLAVKRHADELRNGMDDFIFHEERAVRPCRFLELLPHVKGSKWADKTLVLEPWQCWLYTTVYGWVFKAPQPWRRFLVAYLEVARKNTKTTGGAGLLLYHAAADDEYGAECYTVSSKMDQARICWDIARQMVNVEPRLVEKMGFKPWQYSITQSTTGRPDAVIRALSKDNKGSQDGLNPSFVVVDEVHALTDSSIRDAMRTAMGSRTQPLLWEITTAGADRTSFCYNERQFVEAVLRGQIDAPRRFGVIYHLDKDSEWRDPANWIKANPCLGVSVSEADIADEALEAEHVPAKLNNFLRKRMNVWAAASDAWVDMNAWVECAAPTLSLQSLRGREAWVGVDLATMRDLCAVAIVCPVRAEDGGVTSIDVWVQHYLPEYAPLIAEANTERYKSWVTKPPPGLTITPGNVADYDRIGRDLDMLKNLLAVEVVGYDPWNATQFVQHATDRGHNMVEVAQKTRQLSEPMKWLDAAIANRNVRHPGHRVLDWQMGNVELRIYDEQNWRPVKPNEPSKIDGVMAMLTALALLVRMKPGAKNWATGSSLFIALES